MAEKKKKSSFGVLTAIGIFLIGKMKLLLGLLKFAKFSTLISLFISLGAYAIFYGWKFAVALVYLIFVHEMGHLVAAKLKKIPSSPAIFIPFMGAVIGVDPKNIKDAKSEAFLAYGGPLAGFISFLPAIPLYIVTGNPFWGLVIQLGGMINLFNLIPISPLDGGRIVTVLSTKIWFLGLLGFLALSIFSPDPMTIIILIVGFFTWWDRLRDDYKSELSTKRKDVLVTLINRKHLIEVEIDELREQADIETNEYQKERLLFLIENKKTVFTNQLKAEIQSNLQELSQMKNFYIPLFQDNEKIKKDTLKQEINYLNTVLNNGDLLRHLHDAEDTLTRLKTYYKTDSKTKWTWLFLYLLLAGLLALGMVYGTHIMESHPDLLRK